MGECICRVWRESGRTRAAYQQGSHHERKCPLHVRPAHGYCPECDGDLCSVRDLLVCFRCKPNRWFERATMQPAQPAGAKLFDPTRHTGDADVMYQFAKDAKQEREAILMEDMARERD